MSRNQHHQHIAPETYITTHQAGDLLQVNPSSINKWAKEKRITCHRTPGGHRRIKAADLVEFLTKHKMPIPVQLKPPEETKKHAKRR